MRTVTNVGGCTIRLSSVRSFVSSIPKPDSVFLETRQAIIEQYYKYELDEMSLDMGSRTGAAYPRRLNKGLSSEFHVC